MLTPDRNLIKAEPNTTSLNRTNRGGRDMVQLEFVPKTLTPEDLKKDLAEKYNMLKMEVIKGDEAWLPEADWPRMKVYRIEAAVKVADPKAAPDRASSTRIHFEGYLVQFGQPVSIMVIATTSRGRLAPFRDEVEQILKSIQLDPPSRPVK